MNYRPVTYPNGWVLTAHAQQRLDEMGLTATDVFRAILAPELVYQGRPDQWGHPRELRVRANLVVVVTPVELAVVTVMWHRATGRQGDGMAA
jgi:hypothetical protein